MAEIPEKYKEFLKKVIEMAKEEGIAGFTGEIMPSPFGPGGKHVDSWPHNIAFRWHRGRHGEPAQLRIESTTFVHIEV